MFSILELARHVAVGATREQADNQCLRPQEGTQEGGRNSAREAYEMAHNRPLPRYRSTLHCKVDSSKFVIPALTTVTHPQYSRDIAPSDYLL
ncbi:hypothetical protein KIN20_012393 [Parelaphostrongylus tenuis]|uniref:Uncharacterized protein n=1 Tax=Parelaphostrongylus tenuis TaxID=148309 RepID=A0AAD5QN50_PARTN|nr:hypothetical protein KIN20_012393 [Parelaphostrongylus tenuis]